MSREHVTVALSGEGADELFGGYVTYLADRYARWARRLPAVLLATAVSLADRVPVSDEKISFEYKLKRFLKGCLLPPDEAHVFWNGAFADQEKSVLMLMADRKPIQTLFAELTEQRGISLSLAFDFQYYLPDDILCKVDRMSMAHSLEVRPPFLDHRICEFALSLPDDFKIRGSQLKFVLRELMKGKLPPSILRRKKVGFDIPAHEWLRGPLKSLLLDTLTKQAIKRTNLLRWETVEALLKAHLDRRANWGYQLWGLMILVLWINKWQMHGGPSLSSLSLQRSSSAASTVPRI
jgi:asparagine synthase (glutamine-hydrolysing)